MEKELKLNFFFHDEIELEKPEKLYSPEGWVIVLGAGGVGWWLIGAMSRMNITHPVGVYDPDTFQGGNGKKRLPIPEKESKHKVRELREWLTEWQPDLPFALQTYAMPFAPSTLLDYKRSGSGIRLVVDCTDARPSLRKQIWNACSDWGIPYVRLSYDAQIVSWSHTPPLSVVDNGNYENIPNMGMTWIAGGFGAEMVRRTLRGENCPDKTITVGEIFFGGTREQEVSLHESLARQIEEAQEDENDPWVTDEDGNRIGRLSEFEVEGEIREEELEEELSEHDRRLLEELRFSLENRVSEFEVESSYWEAQESEQDTVISLVNYLTESIPIPSPSENLTEAIPVIEAQVSALLQGMGERLTELIHSDGSMLNPANTAVENFLISGALAQATSEVINTAIPNVGTDILPL